MILKSSLSQNRSFGAENPRQEINLVGYKFRVQPNSSDSAFVLPFGCQSRALPPAFLYRRLRVYLKEPRLPLESPLWYDRFSWQNPVRVTHSVPPECWPFRFPIYRPAGRPWVVRFPSFSSLATFIFLPATPLKSNVSCL
jgi:hypothetical protein